MFLFFEGRVLEHLYSLWRKESELVDGSDEAEQGSHLLRGAARRNVRHLDHIGAGRHCGSVLWRTSTERHLNPTDRSVFSRFLLREGLLSHAVMALVLREARAYKNMAAHGADFKIKAQHERDARQSDRFQNKSHYTLVDVF